VIIVEDDLEFSPDFFEYFEATLPLLKSDPSLWCVSAWNDNGKEPIR
jgi:alpha-1,3-mannosyl-glycoprotein beta-1,2-N-acetylglucosaminyltransferase